VDRLGLLSRGFFYDWCTEIHATGLSRETMAGTECDRRSSPSSLREGS